MAPSRPIVDGIRGIRSFGGVFSSDVSIIGIDFYCGAKDPSNSQEFSQTVLNNDDGTLQGISWAGGGNILIEDCQFSYFDTNIVIQCTDGPSITNVAIRRNIVTDSYCTVGHSQGAFLAGIDGLLLEENVFDRNGWNTAVMGPVTSEGQFNHNVYEQATCTGTIIVRGNISANTTDNDLMIRSGGTIVNNLCINGQNGIIVGNADDTFPVSEAGTLIAGNLVTGCPGQAAIISSSSTSFGWGATITDNVILHAGSSGIFVMGLAGNVGSSITNNVIYDWGTLGISLNMGPTGTIQSGNVTDGTGYPDPNRTIASYDASLGGTGSVDDFLAASEQRTGGTWNTAYSAANAINYVRAALACLLSLPRP